MPAALVTIPGVEIARAGTWDASTGRWACTVEDLADAVRAAGDPAFRTPVIKLGHDDPRFNGAVADPDTGQAAPGDGQPAVGRVENLRLSEDGQVLVGDLVGVPAWLKEILPSAYPSRSIEALLQVQTAAGQSYRMVVTGLALLGVTPPAIENLNDLRDLYGVTSDLDAYVAARSIAASVPPGADMPTLRTVTNDGLPERVLTPEQTRELEQRAGDAAPEGTTAEGVVEASATLDQLIDAVKGYAAGKGLSDYVWTREVYTDRVILDDDYGRLWEVPWTENGGAFTFTGPYPVEVQYVRIADTVAARAVHQARYPLRYARDRGNAAVQASQDERTAVADLTDAARAVREALGLTEDATDEQVQEAMLTRLQSPPDTPQATGDAPAATPTAPVGDPAATTQEPVQPEPVLAAAATEELRRVSAELAEMKERERVQTRASVVSAARRDGKIKPADEATWVKRYDRDPAMTTEILESLAVGTAVPVAAKGRAGSIPEDEGADEWDQYAPLFGIKPGQEV